MIMISEELTKCPLDLVIKSNITKVNALNKLCSKTYSLKI